MSSIPRIISTDELAIAQDERTLIDRLDLLLCASQMSETTKNNIEGTLQQIDEAEWKVKTALYLTLISPDYNIQK